MLLICRLARQVIHLINFLVLCLSLPAALAVCHPVSCPYGLLRKAEAFPASWLSRCQLAFSLPANMHGYTVMLLAVEAMLSKLQ